jgi:Rieske 2Fe-2S family protein
MAGLRRASRIEYEVKANWKLLIHNYSECLHCPVNHPMLERFSHYKSGVNEPATDDWLGGAMDLREGVETLTLDGVRRREWLPGLGPEQRRRVYYYAILPNLLLSLHPDYMMTHTLWPLECDRTRVVCEWHFDAAEMERAGFDPDDAVRFWDQTNREDWALSELTQAGLSSRGFRPGPYSAREGLLADFDRIILGACQADG